MKAHLPPAQGPLGGWLDGRQRGSASQESRFKVEVVLCRELAIYLRR